MPACLLQFPFSRLLTLTVTCGGSVLKCYVYFHRNMPHSFEAPGFLHEKWLLLSAHYTCAGCLAGTE